jgi:hypothetical protein
MWGALSDERSGLKFSVVAGPCKRNLSRFESSGTRDHILLSQCLRLPQPGGPGSFIYFPQEQGSPVLTTRQRVRKSRISSK